MCRFVTGNNISPLGVTLWDSDNHAHLARLCLYILFAVYFLWNRSFVCVCSLFYVGKSCVCIYKDHGGPQGIPDSRKTARPADMEGGKHGPGARTQAALWELLHRRCIHPSLHHSCSILCPPHVAWWDYIPVLLCLPVYQVHTVSPLISLSVFPIMCTTVYKPCDLTLLEHFHLLLPNKMIQSGLIRKYHLIKI